MGSGKKKDHESFTVAPADEPAPGAKSTPAIAPVTAGDTSMLDQYTSAESLTAISGAGSFADMSHAVGSAQAGLATAAGQSAEQQIPQLAAESNKAIHTASQDWLKGKSKAELEEIAAAEGFPHPEMVSDHALMAWLDPSYPADSEYKAKIAAKSIERYNDAVAAGKIVPKVSEELPEGFWKATPAEVLDAQAAFLAAAENVPKSGAGWGNKTEKLDELIAAENKLATAHCPELGDSLEASKAQAKQLVDDRIASSHTTGDTLVKHAIETGQLPAHADLLAKSEALQLVRASTPAEQKATLSALIDQRAATVAEMDAAKATLLEHYDGKLYGKPKPFGSAQDIIDFNTASKQYRSGLQEFNGWHAVASKPMYMGDDALAQGLRHGAKSLSMDQMRAAATMQGLKDNKGASRAQLQNWMIGQWHSGYNPDEIAAQFGAKKPQPKPQPAPTPTPVVPKPKPAPASGGASSSSAGSGGGSVTPFSPTAGSGKWFNKQQQMVAALKHQAASLADAPARPPAAEVAGWQFGQGPSMHLGGAHTKEVVSAPDGSLWMFKPTKDSYRAQSESGANGILHRAGIPTVPVYAHTHDGQKGTVQPLMKGATTFPSSPSEWSQSDVDAIVRYHAAAWLVGDHDAKYDNLLRTPNGGVVPIDHGQAFKFWGQDKLAADFHPNASYGSKPPVWNVLYDAAKNGQLAPGVKVRSAAALPVIKSIESIPDAEFKAMLEPSAKTGAHSGSSSHWRPVFEKRAAAKHGGKATTQQVADEFVAYGVERKNALRQSFTKLFADLGIDKADTISKVA
ncbi:hypothetical protein EB73_34895 [Mycobacterium sp. SWH-M3]|nr:hypothetical protein EB73_34895 [Mycobacterium sp. SWH-M3]